MNGLPCLRRGNDAWHLPLSRQASDLFAAILLSGRAQDQTLRQLTTLMRVDPPLLIFAALATESVGKVTLGELAERLTRQLPDIFAATASPLATPFRLSEDDAAWYSRLEKLRRSFLRMPLARWLPAATKWLELVGPAVPTEWSTTWPTVCDCIQDDVDSPVSPGPLEPLRCNEPITYYPTQLDLAALARQVNRGQRLLESFETELQTSKRAALRQFAYGLSHEINNPLANISTRAQTLMRGESDTQRRQSLQRIVDQAMRAHEMTADLMFYAHPPAPRKTRFNLADLIPAVVQPMRESLADRAIEVVIEPSSLPVIVDADRSMMTEAIRSLLLNSLEAIGCDGQVLLGCDRDVARQRAMVTVSDSGPGLSASAIRHAFDPYYSGREAGRGLGVGLCRVETIAQIHQGDVRLSSGTVGCTARVWIPLAS